MAKNQKLKNDAATARSVIAMVASRGAKLVDVKLVDTLSTQPMDKDLYERALKENFINPQMSDGLAEALDPLEKDQRFFTRDVFFPIFWKWEPLNIAKILTPSGCVRILTNFSFITMFDRSEISPRLEGPAERKSNGNPYFKGEFSIVNNLFTRVNMLSSPASLALNTNSRSLEAGTGGHQKLRSSRKR